MTIKDRYVSWEEVQKFSEELADKVRASGFKPDYLVGVTIGGLVPLALVATRLGIRTISIVSASSYEGRKQGKLHISCLPEIELKGKKVLLIDEIADTGETLRQISALLLKDYEPSELKTATLIIDQAKCKFIPDFFVWKEHDTWAIFPWEKSQ